MTPESYNDKCPACVPEPGWPSGDVWQELILVTLFLFCCKKGCSWVGW